MKIVNKKNFPYVLLIICLFLMVFGQVMNKKGTEVNSIINIFYIIGYVSLIVRGILWIYVIKKLPISFAYPFMSLSFVLILLPSTLYFKESISINNIIGSLIIILGIVFISRNSAGDN